MASSYKKLIAAQIVVVVCLSIMVGCGVYHVVPTEVRNLPCEIRQSLSPGDTRTKVHSVLGSPFIYVPRHPVEVFRHTGRDIEIHLPGVPIPTPLPGEKVVVFVLVAYDSNQRVVELAADTWSAHGDFWITAGNYHFVSNFLGEPQTLLGPAISMHELTKAPVVMGSCRLVLIMRQCVMERILLDGREVADLSPAGTFCAERWNNNLYGTYLLVNIRAGRHQLDVAQKKRHSEFSTAFDCASGATLYAELHAESVEDIWWGAKLKGEILISKEPFKKLMNIGELSPILWHGGEWYDSLSSDVRN